MMQLVALSPAPVEDCLRKKMSNLARGSLRSVRELRHQQNPGHRPLDHDWPIVSFGHRCRWVGVIDGAVFEQQLRWRRQWSA